MFPSPDLPFPSVRDFVESLNDDQRRFYLALEHDREQRLQSTLKAASVSLSEVSGLLNESIQVRLDEPAYEDDGTEDEEQEYGERVIEDGEEVAYQDWDSGGPGAGAGRVSILKYEGLFFVCHDAGLEGGYATIDEAMEASGAVRVTDATVAIWRKDRGFVFSRE
ncbi:MAG TPA: hypothetical protein VNM48_14125 [Chloroflexota bacterium]|nr:hypothetical protein [Chloroflexota bacterium]